MGCVRSRMRSRRFIGNRYSPFYAPPAQTHVTLGRAELPASRAVVRLEVGLAGTHPGVEQQPALRLGDEVAHQRVDSRLACSGLLRGPDEIAEVNPADAISAQHVSHCAQVAEAPQVGSPDVEQLLAAARTGMWARPC